MTPKPVNTAQWDRHTLLVEIFSYFSRGMWAEITSNSSSVKLI
jgi:hypothetical protein